MNENLNLVEILKDCPAGTKLYSPVYGDVELVNVYQDKGTIYPITIKIPSNSTNTFTCERSFDKDGRLFADYSGECLLFPSKDQRDWSKFMTKQSEMEELCDSQEITKWAYISDPLPKQSKFDPKTLQPFDKVLVRDSDVVDWKVQLFSRIIEDEEFYPYVCINESYKYCIPYNDDTKHLVGTTYEAPEFYRY